MERPGNIMPSSILLILFFLIWLTSKIIFIFFEKIVLDNITFKRQKFEGSILRRLKLSFTHNRSEIIATIFHAALNAYSFIITLSVVTYYVDAEACEYICNHMEFFIFFDIVITMTILTLQNYLKKYTDYYVYKCEPIFIEDKIDIEALKALAPEDDIE